MTAASLRAAAEAIVAARTSTDLDAANRRAEEAARAMATEDLVEAGRAVCRNPAADRADCVLLSVAVSAVARRLGISRDDALARIEGQA